MSWGGRCDGVRVLLAGWVGVIVLALIGCGTTTGGWSESDADHWVVVTYEVVDGDPAMMMLLDSELAADEALQNAAAGFIDGNEIGQDTYDMYFIGQDRERMWSIIEPILGDAREEWIRVELRDGLEDQDPIIIDR